MDNVFDKIKELEQEYLELEKRISGQHDGGYTVKDVFRRNQLEEQIQELKEEAYFYNESEV